MPSHIKGLAPLIRSLKAQTFPPDAIYINLPRECGRTKQKYNVPAYLQNDPDVIINWVDEDYGPSTKLL